MVAVQTPASSDGTCQTALLMDKEMKCPDSTPQQILGNAPAEKSSVLRMPAPRDALGRVKYGSRVDVWHNRAVMTKGHLTRDQLCLSSSGRIVSKAQSEAARARLYNNPQLAELFRANRAILPNLRPKEALA